VAAASGDAVRRWPAVALLEATARAIELMEAAAPVVCGLVVGTGSRDAWPKEEERKAEKERKRRERKWGK
jgi:hypothetical protein